MLYSSKMLILSVGAAALALSACADDNARYTRVASVGSAGGSGGDGGSGGSGGSGSGGSGGGGGTSSSGGILVAAGNVLVGAASQYASLSTALNGGLPGIGTVNGTVTALLQNSGHTLIQLDSGTSLLIPGTGGHLGDLLNIDLGSGRVIGGPSGSPLIGLNVLAANPTTGRLATVNAASGNQLVGVTVLNSALGGTGGIGGIGGAGGAGASTNQNIILSPVVAPLLGLNLTGGLLASGSSH